MLPYCHSLWIVLQSDVNQQPVPPSSRHTTRRQWTDGYKEQLSVALQEVVASKAILSQQSSLNAFRLIFQ